MKWFAGIDGGATKTLAVVGDETGRILGGGRSGPANHQTVGPAGAESAVRDALGEALRCAGVPLSSLDGVLLGLAGADYPSDFALLDGVCRQTLAATPFSVVNDSWVALRGGTRKGWGVVSVCGTGSNTAGRTPDGREHIVIGMSYEFGTRGGATDLIREAAHWAFRAAQQAGPSTLLTSEIPRLTGVRDMAELGELAYALGAESMARLAGVPPAIFRLASAGDRVCQDILVTIGDAQGQAAGGVIRLLDMAAMPVEIVMAGSVWLGECPLMRDAFTLAVHRIAPAATPRLPEFGPVAGAYLMALENAGVMVGAEHYDALAESWSIS